MAHSSSESPNPSDFVRQSDPSGGQRQPARSRRITLSLLMDDGQMKSFNLPSALEHPAQFSLGELERLTRAYAEALGLLSPKR